MPGRRMGSLTNLGHPLSTTGIVPRRARSLSIARSVPVRVTPGDWLGGPLERYPFARRGPPVEPDAIQHTQFGEVTTLRFRVVVQNRRPRAAVCSRESADRDAGPAAQFVCVAVSESPRRAPSGNEVARRHPAPAVQRGTAPPPKLGRSGRSALRNATSDKRCGSLGVIRSSLRVTSTSPARCARRTRVAPDRQLESSARAGTGVG
jgi:hypothetical protein